MYSGHLIHNRATRSPSPLIGWSGALFAALLPVLTVSLANAADAPAKITSVEGITEYELANGLEVLLFPDASKPTVTVNVTYRVGSRHEGRGEAGMAHLLEHMVFKGTPTHPNIWGALEDHGASFNGTTWVDRTNYFETLSASDENLEFAIGMEADRMVNSTISAEELAKEMTVVRNEFEMGENSPSGVLSERMMSAAYLWHNYGKSTIGNRSDIERVPADNLRRFYQKYYQPDNATAIVAGRFEPEQALALINKHFGGLPRPERVLEPTYTEEPAQDGPRMVMLNRVGDVAAAGLVYHMPAGTHPDFPAVQVLEGVLTDEPSGRLYQALVETGLASRVRGSAFAWAEPGVLELMATVAGETDARTVLDKMQQVVEGLASAGISDEEVDRIKTRMLKGFKMAMTDSGRIGIRLSESIALGDWRMFFVNRDRLKEVTTADVQRVARQYLLESNRTAGLFIPQQSPMRATVPPVPDVAGIVADYRSTEEVDAGEVFAATPENLDSRTRRITMPSGIKVALLPKETRGNAVNARFRMHFGNEKDLTGHNTAIELIPSMLMRGTKDLDHQQLLDAIDKLQSRINVGEGMGRGRRGGMGGGGGRPGTVSASIESDRENIAQAIALLGEIFRKPAFAPDEFKLIVQERSSMLEQMLSNPQAKGMIALTRAMSSWPKESIHYVPTIEERIEQLESTSLGEIEDVYARFYGADHLEVAVVGDFDEQAVVDAITRAFGGWKSSIDYQRVAQPNREFSATTEEIDTPDKQMAMVAMGTSFSMRDDDPDYPAVNLAAYVLGQSAKSRLINRLRHQGGLSYGARGSLRADSLDERTSLTATAICAPQNAEKALTAMREEILAWMADGVTDQELSEAKVSLGLRLENTLANDRFVVGELADGLEINRDFAYQAKLLQAMQALTVGQIRDALQRRLSNSPFVALKAGDLSVPADTGEAPVSTPAAADADAADSEATNLPERLAQFDTNGDGKLQKDEAPERMQQFFDRMDSNHDGAIDASEAAAMRARRGEGRDRADRS